MRYLVGGSTGIGRALVDILLEERHEVIVFSRDRRDLPPVEWVEVRGDVQVDGFFALDELKVVAGSGCDAYYRAVAIGREVVQRERA